MTKVFNLYEARNQLPRKSPCKPMNRLGVTHMADDFDAPWVLLPEAEVRHKKKGKGQ